MTPTELLPLIGSSQDTARTLSNVAERAGASRREVEQAVQAARMLGYPVCSSGAGLWRAQTAAEALSMAERLRGRALHQLLTARAMRQTGRRMQRAEQSIEQPTLWEAA